MATKHPKVDVVTIGAGWTSAILGAKLCPKGTTMVALEQGTHRWTYPDFAHDHDSLRYSVRYAMMVDLARETWTWRPTPDKPGAADAPVRLVQPGRGPRRRGDPLVGAALALPPVRLPPPLAHRRALRRVEAARRAPRSRTGRSATTSSSPTTTPSSGTSAPPGIAGNIRGEDPSRRQPVRGAAQPRLPEPAARDEPLRGHVRQRLQGARPAPVPAAGRDHLTRLHRPVRQPPLRLPLLRLLHPLRLRGRREGEPAEHAPPGRARDRPLRRPARLQGAPDRDRRATGSRPASPTSTARGRSTSSPPTSSSPRPSRSRTTGCSCSHASKQHPDGIGNDRGRVGRNYTYQIYPQTVVGLWEGEKLNMYMGNTCTINIVYDYNADVFDHSDLDFIGGMQLFSEPGEREPVNSVTDLKTKSGKTWGAEWKQRARPQLGQLRRDRHRGRVDPLRGPVPRPRPELHATASATRCCGSRSAGTRTRSGCGGTCTRARSRS